MGIYKLLPAECRMEEWMPGSKLVSIGSANFAISDDCVYWLADGTLWKWDRSGGAGRQAVRQFAQTGRGWVWRDDRSGLVVVKFGSELMLLNPETDQCVPQPQAEELDRLLQVDADVIWCRSKSGRLMRATVGETGMLEVEDFGELPSGSAWIVVAPQQVARLMFFDKPKGVELAYEQCRKFYEVLLEPQLHRK